MRVPRMTTVTINWVHDEQVDIEVDGVRIFTANHDEQGWDDMQAVIDLTKALAGKLGAEVRTGGVPNL